MQQYTAEQKLVLTLLRELLAQRGTETPQIPLQRYGFALRSLVYASPCSQKGRDTSCACHVIVEALHLICRKSESDPLPWVKQVEDTTYDAFLRLQRL